MGMLPFLMAMLVGMFSLGLTISVVMVMMSVVMTMQVLMLHGRMPVRVAVFFSRQEDRCQDEQDARP